MTIKSKKLSPQCILFSATCDEHIKTVIKDYFSQLDIYPVMSNSMRFKGVKLLKFTMSEETKPIAIQMIYKHLESCQKLIFTNKKQIAIDLEKQLNEELNVKAIKLIGGLEIKERDDIIDQFRKGNIDTLISTNVLARGIDVPEVDLVINYDVPMYENAGYINPDVTNFVHRSGRTGRFGTDGLTLTLVSDGDGFSAIKLDEIAESLNLEFKNISNVDELFETYKEMRQGEA
uniref:Helicase C-terminal domain-containing protein n=1 Tax=Strombidium rassoulzadegani TaxID=1082188 RepID=A0A7S3FTQ4_9SPIT|mmetsp:Transcript_11300/g.19019  ORF Transcript_11300/g.19019 Transcript_11300/m.19019 type:complete len:232 (+) Transcript_11300:612-1307(+)